MSLEVDAGEKEIISILTQRSIEFTTSGHSHQIGDMRKDDTTIERKSISDFFSNIHQKSNGGMWIDDHMLNQIYDMLQYPTKVLIVSGSYADLRPKDRTKIPAYYNSIAQIIKNGITVLTVENDSALVSLALSIMSKSESLSDGHRIVKRNKNAVHGLVHAASPRISWKMREALLEKFGCPLKIGQASKEQLMEVKNVGWTIASNIYNNFRAIKE